MAKALLPRRYDSYPRHVPEMALQPAPEVPDPGFDPGHPRAFKKLHRRQQARHPGLVEGTQMVEPLGPQLQVVPSPRGQCRPESGPPRIPEIQQARALGCQKPLVGGGRIEVRIPGREVQLASSREGGHHPPRK